VGNTTVLLNSEILNGLVQNGMIARISRHPQYFNTVVRSMDANFATLLMMKHNELIPFFSALTNAKAAPTFHQQFLEWLCADEIDITNELFNFPVVVTSLAKFLVESPQDFAQRSVQSMLRKFPGNFFQKFESFRQVFQSVRMVLPNRWCIEILEKTGVQ
jgi:hypothetical protein